jgi:nucleoside-diphosphate-sugar epimerase
MRVLITGNRGYIGSVMVRAVQAAGHEVVGLDCGFFAGCELEPVPAVPTLNKDVRDVDVVDLRGFDGVIHLANLSNDPLGTLNPTLTREINVEATVRLGELARAAGVQRFVNSSSCSVYGAATESWVDEETPPRPVTAYGESKLHAEEGLARLADRRFCVTSLRNATAFGYSPSLRLDLVVNELVAGALLTGEVQLRSDGSAWRPIVHIRDIASAFVLALTAPAEMINGRSINVGSSSQNHRVIDIAEAIVGYLPEARLIVQPGADADRRSYRVRFDLIGRLISEFECTYDLQAGVAELDREYRRTRLRDRQPFVRLNHLRELLANGRLDSSLRFGAQATLGVA